MGYLRRGGIGPARFERGAEAGVSLGQMEPTGQHEWRSCRDEMRSLDSWAGVRQIEPMNWLSLLTWCSALGSGLIAGVFYAFSSFVMPALRQLPAAQGIAAMQAINRTALTPPFLLVFAGTALSCLVLAVASFFEAGADGRTKLRWAGCAAYLVGAFLVTAICNVPRNDMIAKLDALSSSSVASWQLYLSEWTAYNHVRALAALAALVLLVLSR
jgi:uncharacterized membrane protein